MPDKSLIKTFPFQNKGLVTKADPSRLQDGQLPACAGIASVQEGAICTRSGSWQVLSFSPGGAPSIHTIKKFRVSNNDAANPRYIGFAGSIYRSAGLAGGYGGGWSGPSQVDNGINVIPGAGSDADYYEKRWDIAEYSAGASGNPWAFIATLGAMFKDYGLSPLSILKLWGCPPAVGAATVALDGTALANPGPNTNVPGATAYDYRYTYYDTTTGNEGNPSQETIRDVLLPLTGAGSADGTKGIDVTVFGFGSTWNGVSVGVAAAWSIRIYRRGGTFADGLYRLAGLVTNVSPIETAASTFVDQLSDADIAFNQILEFDNDLPVTSTLPNAYQSAVSAGVSAGAWAAMAAVLPLPAGVAAGTQVTIVDGPDRNEVVTISAVTGASTFRAYFQHSHASDAQLLISSIVGRTAFLCCAAFDSLFVAGDPNNPHVLYKSKTGRPEAFPVIASDGSANSINVGTPSNPILGIGEFQGYIVCLNKSDIFTVQVFNGAMLAPQRTLAQRGLFSRYAWCKADNEIYFLAYDGVYSWAGGQCIKRSEQIDQIFHGKTVNIISYTNGSDHSKDAGPIFPIDLYNQSAAGAMNFCKMEYVQNKVTLLYRDINGNTQCIQYEPLFDRWTPYSDPTSPASFAVNTPPTFTTLNSEPDTGLMAIARFGGANPSIVSYVDQDVAVNEGSPAKYQASTTDEFTGAGGGNGSLVHFDFMTPWFLAEEPSAMRLYKEAVLDAEIPASGGGPNTVNIQTFYDFSQVPDATDTFTLTGPLGGGRTINSLVLGKFGGNYSAGRDARVIAFRFFGNTNRRIWFHALSLRYEERGLLSGAYTADWDNQGYEWDKRFYSLTIEYIALSQSGLSSQVDLLVDIRGGVNGSNESDGIASFSMNTTTIPSTEKTSVVFAMPDGVIGKEVRIRGKFETADYRILSWKFDYEKYPADRTFFSPWEDEGSRFLKYCQMLELDVDTGGQAVPVKIQADGATVCTLTAQTTGDARRVTLTGLGNISGRQWRYLIDPTTIISVQGTCNISGTTVTRVSSNTVFTAGMVGMFFFDGANQVYTKILAFVSASVITLAAAPGNGTNVQFSVDGKFQVWGLHWDLLPADRGPVVNTIDYDDLGTPNPKKLTLLDLEYDSGGQAPPTIVMDVVEQDGVTITLAKQTFVLTSTGRARQQFLIADNTIVQMVRLHPTATLLQTMKSWNPIWQKVDYPPIIAPPTEWDELGHPYPKMLRTLVIDINTNGVQATGFVGVDGAEPFQFTVTSTLNDRTRVIPIPDGIIGESFRLRLVPGVGGFTQLFPTPIWQKVDYPPIIAPPTEFDDLGYPCHKILRSLVIDMNTNGIPASGFIGVDGAEPVTFTVTTTLNDRARIITMPENIIGKRFRLRLVAGVGGYTQLFSFKFQVVREPCPNTSWISYAQTFGYAQYKWIRQCWFEYRCAVPITMNIYRDGRQLFFTTTLPAHAARDTERFYLPPNSGAALNKSKVYEIELVSSDPAVDFYFYTGSVEWMPIGAGIRTGATKVLLQDLPMGDPPPA